MNKVVCRASAAADADQFLSPSHRDGLQSLINTMFLGIWRAFAVTFFSLCALVENAITIPFFAPAQRLHARAAWLHRWSWFACRVIGIRITIRGSMPPSGLLVSNHLTYLDVLVLSSIRPCVFVAKREVVGWPFFGWLARAAGTIFVDRENRLSSPAVVDLVRECDRWRFRRRAVSRRDKLRWINSAAIQVGIAGISRATSLSSRFSVDPICAR